MANYPYSQQTINTVLSLVPIDDVMFQKICEDINVCQEMISTILGEPVTVISVTPQDSIMNLQGRSVRLDCLCLLSDGTYVNVEVQKADDDDHQARVGYNAAVVTASRTPKSVKFKDVAKVIVIFITKFDIFHDGLPIYHVDRIIRETKKFQENGFKEIYVNAAVKKYDTELNANVSDLMKLFTDRKSFNYDKFPFFSHRKNDFINTPEGVKSMCEKVENAFQTILLEKLFSYVQKGGMALAFAANEANLSIEDFKTKMQEAGYTDPATTPTT